MLSPELLEILVCPGCKGELEHVVNDDNESLICRACKLEYLVIEDIPIMRIDKAKTLNNHKDKP